MPVEMPIVATDVFALLQVPLPVASLSKVVPPMHVDRTPVMEAAALTVTMAVATQLPVAVYEMTDVPPDVP